MATVRRRFMALLAAMALSAPGASMAITTQGSDGEHVRIAVRAIDAVDAAGPVVQAIERRAIPT